MKEVELSRKELYDLVWTESMLALSKRYAISDVGLRKKCKALEISVPNLGYWAKLKFGKKVISRKPLKDFNGDQKVILRIREASELSKETRFNLLKQIESDVSLNLKVPENLTNPDSLIRSLKDDLYKSKVWSKKEGIVHSSQGVLNVKVSPKNVGRTLRVMDTLIKALKHRGHNVEIEYGKTNVVLEGEKIPLCFRETLTRDTIQGKYGDYTDNQATGLLSVKIDESYSSKEWVEGKKPIEELLPNIIVYLEMKGKRLKEERIERERYWAEQREKERKEKEIQDRKEKELRDFKDLFRNAKRHAKAEEIRKYADELERVAKEKNIFNDDLKAKIEWARKKADWYDPFIEAEDEVMEGIDRDELKLEKEYFHWLNR